MTSLDRPLSVLLTTEGTYPHERGGVSTWCNTLIQGLPDIRYTVYAVVGHPFVTPRFTVPPEVNVLTIPLWGQENPSAPGDRFVEKMERRRRTTGAVVSGQFLPLLDELLHLIGTDPPDGAAAGKVFQRMHRLFQLYDYGALWKSGETWRFFVAGLQNGRWLPSAEAQGDQVSLESALHMLGWLYHFLIVLIMPVPRTDVVHASAAAFCGLPGVIAKLERQTPFLLTEHGVYLREQYATIGKSDLPPLARLMLLKFVRLVVAANYAYADLVAPVCAFNARWERRLGVPASRIRVMYNGADPEAFPSAPPPSGRPPTVVTVARIDPAKDIITLLHAAAIVRRRVPNVKFVVYGHASVPAYDTMCRTLHSELGLGGSFVFAGHTSDTAAAYASGDVVVLSSVTEGFPYAVVEAMLSGRPVVATDVGGTKEALADAGLLVPPRRPQEMADAVVALLRQPARRQALAAAARNRAVAYFTVERNLIRYAAAYEQLARGRALPDPGTFVQRRRQLALARAAAFAHLGEHAAAASEVGMAITLAPRSPAVPFLLLRLAALYVAAGDEPAARRELERARAWQLAADAGALGATAQTVA